MLVERLVEEKVFKSIKETRASGVVEECVASTLCGHGGFEGGWENPGEATVIVEKHILSMPKHLTTTPSRHLGKYIHPPPGSKHSRVNSPKRHSGQLRYAPKPPRHKTPLATGVKANISPYYMLFCP